MVNNGWKRIDFIFYFFTWIFSRQNKISIINSIRMCVEKRTLILRIIFLKNKRTIFGIDFFSVPNPERIHLTKIDLSFTINHWTEREEIKTMKSCNTMDHRHTHTQYDNNGCTNKTKKYIPTMSKLIDT